MRVLHVVPTYLPAVRYGGPIYSVHALCRALSFRGHEVHVFTTNVDGPAHSDVPLDKPTVIDGVIVNYFACDLGRRLYRSPTMRRAFEAEIPTFDVVHLHSVFLWPTLAAARAARKTNVPYVLAPRGMLVRDLIERKSTLLKTLWIRLFEQRNLRHAAALHLTSELERVEFVRLGIPVHHIAVIANGVDAPELGGEASEPVISQKPFVLSLGRINWKKGLDRLIAAMALVPDAELLIAGNDEESYRSHLENMVQDLNLSDRVRFMGPIRDAEKWRLIRAATLFVLPSHSENFGIAVLEAMACGCPVVVSPEVGLASAIDAAGAGLVVESDPSELGTVIAGLMSDPVRRAAMGEAGKKLASRDYSWKRIAEQTEQLYERCLSKRACRA